ncbi:MAG: rod shape-determining protein [Clostridia bacterium]|nr:rod shape-determining protein [Clostridia bacterium]
MRKGIGIDFGCSFVRANVLAGGNVVCEPAMVAVDRITGEHIKFGNATQKLIAESSGSFYPQYPFIEGIFADMPLAERVLSWCRTQNFPIDDDVRAVVSIPCGFTAEEEGEYAEMVLRAGYRECYQVYSPIAALIGAGYSMEKSYIAVDIGCYTTDVVVVSEGELVNRFCIDKAGYAFTLAIANYIKRKSHLRIGYQMAEEIKRKIGTVWVEGERRPMEIVGRASDNSMRRTVISSDEMFEALEEPCAAVLEVVCEALSKIPAEAVRETFENGIILSGGGSLLEGIDHMIYGVTGVKCRRVPNPEFAVVNGLETILAHLPEQIHNGPNVSGIALKTNAYREKK